MREWRGEGRCGGVRCGKGGRSEVWVRESWVMMIRACFVLVWQKIGRSTFDGWMVCLSSPSPPLSSIPKLDELPWCESIREQPLPGPEGWPDSTPGEEGSHHRGEGEG